MAEKKSNFGKGVATGASIIGAIATGYFLYGPKSTAHRKAVRAWTIKAKGDVLSEFEKMKDVSETSYHDAIDKVTARYAKVKDVSEEEVQTLAGELKKYWKNIQKDITTSTKPKKTAVKKTAKPTQKK